MHGETNPVSQQGSNQLRELHQGDCVQITNDKDLFQIIGIDNDHQKCWIRRWPLLPQGSPVFEVSIQQISIPTKTSQ